MPMMSTIEQAVCRSVPWRAFTRRVAFPWALGTAQLKGAVLELGTGSGANAVALLDRYPEIWLTATDVDPAMLAAAGKRMARFGDRVNVQEADATAVPFPDASFDAVVSLIMLHHVIDWESALGEASRLLRPGGMFAGYDLVVSRPARLLHRLDRSPYRLATASALRSRLEELAFTDILVKHGLGGLVAAFSARRPPLVEEPTDARYDEASVLLDGSVHEVQHEIASSMNAIAARGDVGTAS